MKTSPALAAAFVLCATAAVADDSFCKAYSQTSSTAGPCRDCRIQMSPTSTGYKVVASNGWSATVKPTKDPTVVAGRGKWPQQGVNFSIALTRTGSSKAEMHFVIDGGGLDFTAKFRCTRH